MKTTRTYDVYSDPGHGWVKVRIAELKKLGIEDRITPYSYRRGDHAFLEEDCDAATFENALLANGVEPAYRHHVTDRRSKIRTYSSYAGRSWQ